jgi:predicted amino acid dehydrogenase
LLAVRAAYPDAIREITGVGLMQGIVLGDRAASGSIILRNLYRQKMLGYVCSAYLLKRHEVRTLPSLSAPNVLRVEPSAFITPGEIDKFAGAIEDLARVISEVRVYDLLRPIMDDDNFDDQRGKIPRFGWMYTGVDEPKPGARQVAFIAHFTHPTDELRLIEKDLSKASDTGLRLLQNRMQVLLEMKPLLLFSKNLFHGRVHFSFYLLPIDTAELERLNRKGKRRLIVSKIQKTVDLAAENGATIISLGAYTSIITRNGLALVEPKNCKIVTGNTLTAASGIRRIVDELKLAGAAGLRLGVVGAAGNIGSAIAGALIESGIRFEKVYLLGKGREKLSAVLQEMPAAAGPGGRIVASTDLTLLRQCDVIISAANTNDPIIFPHHIGTEGRVLISDISVPPSISADVLRMDNVRVLNFASYVRLPEDGDFIVSSCTPMGTSYCCAAEPVLLALEPLDRSLRGKLESDNIREITRLAEKHRFFDGIGEGKNFDPIFA